MDVFEYIAALRREGDLLAAAAARSDPDAPVPTCPDWRIRDLVLHIGGVHRWAAAQVARRSDHALDLEEVVGARPDDAGLESWFREGHAALVRALEEAPADLACWSFLPAPSPVAFWARRQAHETAIHRADAESPGGVLTPVPAAFGVDGVDELLLGFLARPGRGPRSDPQRSLHLHAVDAEGEWLVVMGPERTEVRREHAKGDCAVRAAASDLYLLLWNRRSPDGLEVHGDASVLDHWRRTVRVRWS